MLLIYIYIYILLIAFIFTYHASSNMPLESSWFFSSYLSLYLIHLLSCTCLHPNFRFQLQDENFSLTIGPPPLPPEKVPKTKELITYPRWIKLLQIWSFEANWHIYFFKYIHVVLEASDGRWRECTVYGPHHLVIGGDEGAHSIALA